MPIAVGGHTLANLIDSYKRMARHVRYPDLFYDRFIGGHEEVARLFEGVDMERQKFLLNRSLTQLIQHAHGVEEAAEILDAVARRHGPAELDIPEWMYTAWIDALIATVAELDPKFSPELDALWRKVLNDEVAWFRRRARELA